MIAIVFQTNSKNTSVVKVDVQIIIYFSNLTCSVHVNDNHWLTNDNKLCFDFPFFKLLFNRT